MKVIRDNVTYEYYSGNISVTVRGPNGKIFAEYLDYESPPFFDCGIELLRHAFKAGLWYDFEAQEERAKRWLYLCWLACDENK